MLFKVSRAIASGSLSAHALVVLAVLAAGALLHFPALGAGYLTDDYVMHAMLDGSYPVERSPLDLYSFVRDVPGELAALVDRGVLPWWSHPELRLRALRPLSSALIWLDHSLLGLSAFGAHLHSLAWWALLIAAYAAFVRRVLPGVVAAIATALFAFDPAHCLPVGWIANRNTLVSAFFGVLALLFHISYRERAGRLARATSVLAAALALLAGEYGICALAYVFAWELCAGRGGRAVRLRALIPVCVVLAMYVVLYRVFGYGAAASTMYLDPFAAPGEFVLNAIGRFPAALVNEVLTVPGEVTLTAVVLGNWGVLLLLVPLVVVGLLLWDTFRRVPGELRRVLAALLVGALLSLLPLVGTIPSTRILLVPSMGGAALIAVLFWDAARRLFAASERRRPMTWFCTVATLALLPFHVVFAPLASRAGALALRESQDFIRSTIVRGEFDGRAAERDYVLVNAPEPTQLLYVPFVLREAGRAAPRSWRSLAMTSQPLRVRRTAADTLELSADDGLALENPIVHLFRRGDHPLRQGQIVRMQMLEVTVLRMQRWGPSSLRVRFDRSLDDDSLVLMTSSHIGLRRLVPPGQGQELAIGS